MTQLIQLERAANVRELGGYQTINGTTIKRKKLIRSAAINELTASDQAVLGKLWGQSGHSFSLPSLKPMHSLIDQSPQQSSFFYLFSKEDETMVSLSPESLKQRLEDGEDAEEQMKKVLPSLC